VFSVSFLLQYISKVIRSCCNVETHVVSLTVEVYTKKKRDRDCVPESDVFCSGVWLPMFRRHLLRTFTLSLLCVQDLHFKFVSVTPGKY
jgi:hypothetical protein